MTQKGAKELHHGVFHRDRFDIFFLEKGDGFEEDGGRWLRLRRLPHTIGKRAKHIEHVGGCKLYTRHFKAMNNLSACSGRHTLPHGASCSRRCTGAEALQQAGVEHPPGLPPLPRRSPFGVTGW